MIRLHDTMAREKRPFAPLNPQRITMYVCGPTVYGRAHIGNARPAVVFDTLARLIRHEFPNHRLFYARNVTDVDDKIIAAAETEGVGYRVITSRYERHYLADMGALGVLPPDHAPHATGFVPRMIDMISRLIDLGYAYVADGHVLFEVAKDPEYGILSRRDREAILAGARVEVAPFKRDPADFVLWKPAGHGAEQVALSFDSPWGKGRPGWHIECSAMIENVFGDVHGTKTIDIHGGGLDLIFPHHENEIAQSRCAHGGAPLANFWMHNGFVDMGAEKMSKSLGNIITVGQLLEQGHRGAAIRLALLSTHYRQPLPWSDELIHRANMLLDKAKAALSQLRGRTVRPTVPSRFLERLSDDLNTPKALDFLWTHVSKTFALSHQGSLSYLTIAGDVLGCFDMLGVPPEALLGEFESDPLVEARIVARNEAKRRRDFATADRIREELRAEGIFLDDTPTGTTWRRE